MAEVRCGKCDVEANIPVTTVDEPVDAYCKFTDSFYAGNVVCE